MANTGVLIIVENLTVPLDRRVWQEATTLRDAGYTVSVVCPKGGKYTASYEVLDGIHVFRHPLPIEADGCLGYAIEYSWALAWEFALAWRAYFKVGFNVIQACNPPDTIFLLAGLFKALLGMPFVFDHHDINPELFEAKFGRRGFFHTPAAGARALDIPHRRRLDRHQRDLQADRRRARRHGSRPRVHRALDSRSRPLQARRAQRRPEERPPASHRLRRHHGRAGRRRPAGRGDGRAGQRAGPPRRAVRDRRLRHRAREPEGAGRRARRRRLRHVHRLPVGPAAARGVLDLRHRRHSRSEEHLQRQDLDEQGVRVHDARHPVRAVRSRSRAARSPATPRSTPPTTVRSSLAATHGASCSTTRRNARHLADGRPRAGPKSLLRWETERAQLLAAYELALKPTSVPVATARQA